MRMFRRADAPAAGRGRTTAARTTAWSASAAAPAPTPGPALLVRLRGRRARGARRSSPTTSPAPADDFARRRARVRARRRRAAPPVRCSSRSCSAEGLDAGRLPGPLRQRARRRLPASWAARRRAGWLPRRRRPAAADRRRAWSAPTRSARGSSLRPGARPRWRATSRDEPVDPLPRPAGELQLRLPATARSPSGADPPPSCARRPGARWSGSPPGSAAPDRRRGSRCCSRRGARGWSAAGTGERWSTLSHLPHVDRVAIQTNLAGRLDWLAEADPAPLALWATYHPARSTARPLPRPRAATWPSRGVRFSVGVVGLPEHLAEAGRCAPTLPARRLPVGQRRRGPALRRGRGRRPGPRSTRCSRYSAARTQSPAVPCRAGETVDLGATATAPCAAATSSASRSATSTTAPTAPRCARGRARNAVCDCHIGYVHLERLGSTTSSPAASWNASRPPGRPYAGRCRWPRRCTGRWPPPRRLRRRSAERAGEPAHARRRTWSRGGPAQAGPPLDGWLSDLAGNEKCSIGEPDVRVGGPSMARSATTAGLVLK